MVVLESLFTYEINTKFVRGTVVVIIAAVASIEKLFQRCK